MVSTIAIHTGARWPRRAKLAPAQIRAARSGTVGRSDPVQPKHPAGLERYERAAMARHKRRSAIGFDLTKHGHEAAPAFCRSECVRLRSCGARVRGAETVRVWRHPYVSGPLGVVPRKRAHPLCYKNHGSGATSGRFPCFRTATFPIRHRNFPVPVRRFLPRCSGFQGTFRRLHAAAALPRL